MTDPTSFEVFVRDYQDMVYTTALRLLADASEAEDISQEVFLRAYRCFDQLREKPGGWLRTVTTNLCLNHLQRYRARWRFSADASEILPQIATEETSTEPTDRQTALREALQRLPDALRVPLVLHHFDEMSYADIAIRLGISVSKVKTDIFRARQFLIQLLKKQTD